MEEELTPEDYQSLAPIPLKYRKIRVFETPPDSYTGNLDEHGQATMPRSFFRQELARSMSTPWATPCQPKKS